MKYIAQFRKTHETVRNQWAYLILPPDVKFSPREVTFLVS